MIRIARTEDLDQIMNIVKETIEDLQKEGNMQWANDYPTRENFVNDINNKYLYIYEQNCKVAGFICLNTNEDNAYQELSWSLNKTAIVIHRFAIKRTNQKQGIGTKLMEFTEKFARNKNINYIKVDTNSKNSRMNYLFKKMEYNLIGQINLRDVKTVFNCYDKVLK